MFEKKGKRKKEEDKIMCGFGLGIRGHHHCRPHFNHGLRFHGGHGFCGHHGGHHIGRRAFWGGFGGSMFANMLCGGNLFNGGLLSGLGRIFPGLAGGAFNGGYGIGLGQGYGLGYNDGFMNGSFLGTFW